MNFWRIGETFDNPIMFLVAVGSLYFAYIRSLALIGWLYWPLTYRWKSDINLDNASWLYAHHCMLGELTTGDFYRIAVHQEGLLFKYILPGFSEHTHTRIPWNILQNPEFLTIEKTLYLQWKLADSKTLQVPYNLVYGIKEFIHGLEEKHQAFLAAQTSP